MISNDLAIQIKKVAYITLVVPTLLVVMSYLSFDCFYSLLIPSYFTVFFMFVVYGFMDLVVGKDPSNPNLEQTKTINNEYIYTLYLFLCLPLYVGTLIFGAEVLVSEARMTLIDKLGWALSIGSVGSILAVTAGHELIHRTNKIERNMGGVLLALVCYGTFKVEHVRGHHVDVATPNDASTSELGQSLYGFIMKAMYKNFVNAWRLEFNRLTKMGKAKFSLGNELIWWTSISTATASLFGYFYGVEGFAFFLVSSLWAIMILECANYVQHYGLKRSKNADGEYESTKRHHSWNSNFVLSNLSMFQLQRHSDHHENAKVKYQALRHFEECPQLPAGYPLMMLISTVPPLWRFIMDKRVEALQENGAA